MNKNKTVLLIVIGLITIILASSGFDLTYAQVPNTEQDENISPNTPSAENLPLYHGLRWENQGESVQAISISGMETFLLSGELYDADSMSEKPSSALLQFYFPDSLSQRSWTHLGYIDGPGSLQINYYNYSTQRYLVIKLVNCGLLRGSSSKNMCVQVWISDFSTLIPPVYKPAATTVPLIGNSTDFANPLPVPFFSQRLSDPLDNIILGYGSCTTTIHDYGCSLTSYAMLYDYYQANFTNPVSLNETMKVAPGTYVCVDSCCNRWPITPSGSPLPDSPSGLTAVNRYTNDCTTVNCIDAENVPIIDNAINAGLPMHIRVHCAGCDYSSHSVVLIGHVGNDYYIRDPWATDDQTRTLTSGALGQYVVDFIDVSSGTPPSGSCSYNSNQIVLYTEANYGGQCVTKDIGEYSNPSAIGLSNDAISSIRVGSDVQAILCKDDNYLGGCETFTSDDADLSNNSIGDNQVSSLKVVSDVSLEHPIQLYKDADYITGYCYIDSAGWFNLDGVCESYNDQISSFKLQTGWSVRFYKEFGLIGSNQCFTVADSNLSDNTYTDGTGMNDTISSVALYNQSTCPPLVVPPSAPTLSSPANNAVLERTVNLTLSWNSVSGASEYYAEFWGGPSLSVNSGWTTNTSWFLGSQWGGVYQWRVKARNSAGESGWSETRTLTIKYGSPTNLTATAVSTSQINLSWGASVDAPGNIDGYRIYRNGSPIATTTSSTTTYNNTGLNPGTTYSYYVIAYKGTLESDPSNTASATTNSLTCYTLTVSVSPTSSGSVTLNPTPNCNGTQYISGTVVQLTAIPATNYRFVSWSGDISGTSNPTSVTMNGSRNVIANFASTVISDRRIFLPLTINYSGSTVAGIQGRVLLSGAPIGGMQLELLSYDGSTSISILTTTTLSDGTYLFTGVPSLTTGKYYYVRYINSADPSKVYYWATPLLSSYTAGSGFRYGDFDIANVFYTSPVPSATVPLPTTFTWNRRASTTTDSYEFNLLAWDAWNYLFWTDPIGYVGSYTLNSMPAGMYINTPYGWEIWIYSPDGGIGIAYYVRQITFSSTGTNQSMLSIPSRDLDRIPSLDILVLRRLEKIER